MVAQPPKYTQNVGFGGGQTPQSTAAPTAPPAGAAATPKPYQPASPGMSWTQFNNLGATLGKAAGMGMGPGGLYQDPSDQTKAGTGEQTAATVANMLMNTTPMAVTSAQTAQQQLTNPGAGEQNAGDIMHQLQTPGMGETQAQAELDANAGRSTDNRATQFADQFMANRPDINYDAGLDPFYDNAIRKSAEDVNNFASSRGAYGSSAALDLQNEASTNLRAEQANREADYYLRALGEGRQWEGLGGELARSAEDTSRSWATDLADIGLSGQEMGLARTQQGLEAGDTMDRLGMDRNETLSGITARGDDALDSRLSTAGDAAVAAQTLGDDRVQRGLENKLGVSDRFFEATRDAYRDVFSGDQVNFDNSKAADAAAFASKLAAAGVSLAEIGNALGTSTDNVAKLLQEFKQPAEDDGAAEEA